MTLLVILLAAGTGAGLWLLLLSLFPRPPRLDHALNPRIRTPQPEPGVEEPSGWAARVGRPGALWLARVGLPTAGTRHALGSFLDLVVVSLAGGAGVDQALHDAATVGSGTAYAELRYALTQARLSRVPPWDTLAQLGQTVGVDELHQLAATVGLAGSEGAKVRTSLRSRAGALRTRQLTDAEGDASAATERMSLPIILLFGGFLVFLGFPAVVAVLTGL